MSIPHRVLLRTLVAAVCLAASAAPALAQESAARQDAAPRFSVSLRAGVFAPMARAEFFEFVTARASLTRRELHAPAVGGELGFMLTDRLQLLAGIDANRATEDSQYRDQRRADGAPILQTTRLTLGPRPYIGAKAFLRTPSAAGPFWGQGVNAFAGLAFGRGAYELRQWGSFYDERNDVTFDADFRSESTGYFALVSGGAELPLTAGVALVTEAQYHWGRAAMRGDYLGFDPIDVGGVYVSAGLTLRR